MKKIQIVYIHGGMTFKNRRDYLRYLKSRRVALVKRKWWTEDLEKKLGKNYEVFIPRMPLQDNAKYADWAIYFKRIIALFGNNFILIGGSLGGVFLAKFLSEHKLSQKALVTFLVCPPFDNSLPGEDLVGGFKLKSDLSLLEKNSKNVYLLFSRNDKVVPVSHAKKYAAKLPNSKVIIYKHIKGHFEISKFPEIVKLIKQSVKGG